MFANFSGNSTGDESCNKKNDRVETDVGLGNRSGHTGSRRGPAQIDGGSEIGNGGGDAGQPANPGIEAKDGENDEDEKK